MNRLFLLGISCLLLVSCGPSYEGYQTFPYTIRGRRYYPMNVDQALEFKERGIASWYDESSWWGLKRGTTSLGEKVYPWHLIAAHKTLPLPCRVKVRNLENGKTIRLRVNDRGPFIPGRILDVSPRAAKKLGFKEQGLTEVELEVLSIGDGSYKRKKRRKWFFGLF